jgi:hypothetical protein
MHGTAQHHEVLAQLEGAALDLGAVVLLVEQPVFVRLDLGVEVLHGVEVTVDDDVEEAPQQEGRAERGEIGVAVPPLQHGGHVESLGMHRDDGPLGDEGLHLDLAQLVRPGVDAHGVGGEKEMGVVPVELGALVLVHRVLDGEVVQVELLLDGGEVFGAGRREVGPDRRIRVLHIVGDVGDGEVGQHEFSSTVQPGSNHQAMLGAQRGHTRQPAGER